MIKKCTQKKMFTKKDFASDIKIRLGMRFIKWKDH